MRIKIFLLCIAFTIFSNSAYSQPKNLTVITEEWPPYNYMGHNEIKGFSLEIFNSLLSSTQDKYNVDIKLLPSARIATFLNNSERTMMFSMYRTSKREHQYKWIGPLINGSIYLYKRRDNPISIQTLEDAKKVNLIACRQMGIVHDILVKNGFTNLDTSATDSIYIYKKILFGRCDLGISDTPLGVAHQLKNLHYPTNILEKIPIEIFSGDLYIACSKDIPDDEIGQWQKALDQIIDSGQYEEILNRYQ